MQDYSCFKIIAQFAQDDNSRFFLNFSRYYEIILHSFEKWVQFQSDHYQKEIFSCSSSNVESL